MDRFAGYWKIAKARLADARQSAWGFARLCVERPQATRRARRFSPRRSYSLDLVAPGSGWSLESDCAAAYGHGLATAGDWLIVAGARMLDPVSQAAYSE